MFKFLLFSLLFISFAASAQNPGSLQMNEAQMQQMMKKMQDCMTNIDQAELKAFQQKAEKMNTEIKALCTAGKRDAAMAQAMAFGKEVAGSKVMQDMKKCGEGMQAMMHDLPKIAQPHEDGVTQRHICDE